MNNTTHILGIAWYPTQLKITIAQKNGPKLHLVALERLDLLSANLAGVTHEFQTWLETHLPPNARVKAVLSVPESSVFLKELDISSVKPAEIETAIYWEISSIAPLKPSEAVFRWHVLSKTKVSSHIAVMVIKDEVVTELFNTIKNASIKVEAIEIFSQSFVRMVQNDLTPNSLLMSVDENEVNFVVLKRGIPVFSTSTTALLKRGTVGTRTLESETSKTLAQKAESAVHFWLTKNPGSIEQVIITGDVAKFYGLANEVYHVTHIPTFMAKPKLHTIELPKNISQAAFTRFLIPTGASLLLTQKPEVIHLSLLPQSEQKRRNQSAFNIWLRRLFASIFLTNISLLVVCGLVFALMFGVRSLLTRDIMQLKQFITNHPANAYTASIIEMNRFIDDSVLHIENNQDYGQKLKSLALQAPQGLAFTQIKISHDQNEIWQVEGIANRAEILAFYEKIKTDPSIKQVDMPYSNFEKADSAVFKVEIIWNE